MLSSKGDNYISSPKGSGTIKEEDTERPWEPEVVNIWREVILSGQGRTRILFFPECLWLHTQNLDKSKPAEAPAWLGGGGGRWREAPEVPSLTKKLLAVDGCLERDESFSSGMWLLRVYLVLGQSLFVSATLLSVLATPGAPGDCLHGVITFSFLGGLWVSELGSLDMQEKYIYIHPATSPVPHIYL